MSLARLLVVEDDVPIAKLLCQFLEGEGFKTISVESGEDAVIQVRTSAPDLVILDLMLPGMDGIETCLAIRKYFTGPLLMLTAHEGEMQEVIALNAGVDDFVHKPIRPHILKARINALLRRQSKKPSAFPINGLFVDRERRRAFFNDHEITLSESEFELLWALASRAGEVVTRDDLFKQLRCKEYDGIDRSIDMRISKLRRKLSTYTDRDLIRTLRQVGYIFTKD